MELVHEIQQPKLFDPKPLRVWIVIGLLCIYLTVSWAIFFEAVAPVANFSFQPAIEADSGTYWVAAGLHTTDFTHNAQGADAATNLFGPVIEAELLRTDFNVTLFNCLLLLASLSAVGAMREFDRSTFTLLLMLNPMLIPALITLNKEIFALAGMIFFVRYLYSSRYRLLFLSLGLGLSLMARWQQVFVMLLLIALESRFSPFRRHPRWAVLSTLAAFTIGYGIVEHLAPFVFEALLAQAKAGRTVVILDNIQAQFGFPIVVIPKILMNAMGRFITPKYFLTSYWQEDFSNWRDQIFMVLHTFLTTLLLVALLYKRKLRLEHPPVRLLIYYLMMTAVNPMIQPRYEYAAYVLLSLEASRYLRIRDGEPSIPAWPEIARGTELNSHANC